MIGLTWLAWLGLDGFFWVWFGLTGLVV